MVSKPQHPSKFGHFTIVHELRSRIRITAPCLHKDPERTYILEILLRKRGAILQVRAVPSIASVVIQFDPQQLPKANLLALLDKILQNLGQKARHVIHDMHDKSTASIQSKTNITFAVGGMSCDSCALFLEMVLRRDPRISSASVNFITETAQVGGNLDKESIYALVNRQGFEAIAIDTLTQRKLFIEKERQNITRAKKRVIKAGLLSLPVLLIGITQTRTLPLRLLQAILTTPVVFGAGRSFFSKALRMAKQRSANMDTLIALGVGSAYGYSVPALFRSRGHLYFEAASGIIVFVLLGRYLEERAKIMAGGEISKLVNLQPQTATLLYPEEEKIISIDDIVVNDILLVRPGEKIPADGEVIKGLSSVDESLITGSGVPVIKEVGHKLIGGSVNGSGVLHMRVTATGTDSILSGIIHMIDQAQASKLPIQLTADKIAAVFVPTVMVLSGITFSGGILTGNTIAHAFGNAITVLLISCPCALGLATPAATMVGTGQAARRGIYIRNVKSLETASGITAIVFDKTGTITEGDADVAEILNVSRMKDETLIQLAASAEFNSEHFLGRAIVSHARGKGLKLLSSSHFHNAPDKGIRARVGKRELLLGSETWLIEQGVKPALLPAAAALMAEKNETSVFMAVDGKEAALFSIVDHIRLDAGTVITHLHQQNIRTFMVTGDTEKTARHVARQVGIESYTAQADPAKKLQIIHDLQAQGELVAMIGDGINDAPSLAAADVGLAIGTGTDIAIQTADLILVNADLSKVSATIELSNETLRVIKQNLFWAFAYNGIAIPVAMLGKLNPIIASAAMALSSVSVLANSLRLNRK